MAVLTAGVGALRRLALGDIAREGRDHAGAALVRRHHDAIGLILAHVEHHHEDRRDELARRVVVVDQDHLVEARLLDLGLGDGIGLDVDIAHRPSPAFPPRLAGLYCVAMAFRPLPPVRGRLSGPSPGRHRRYAWPAGRACAGWTRAGW